MTQGDRGKEDNFKCRCIYSSLWYYKLSVRNINSKGYFEQKKCFKHWY
jgi:hypothetical protein